jgi:hypothetical protein
MLQMSAVIRRAPRAGLRTEATGRATLHPANRRRRTERTASILWNTFPSESKNMTRAGRSTLTVPRNVLSGPYMGPEQ